MTLLNKLILYCIILVDTICLLHEWLQVLSKWSIRDILSTITRKHHTPAIKTSPAKRYMLRGCADRGFLIQTYKTDRFTQLYYKAIATVLDRTTSSMIFKID